MSKKFRFLAGCLPDAPDERDFLVMPALYKVPGSVDWTKHMSRIRNQGEEGTCVGHAACAVKEFQEKRQYKKVFDFSERFAYEYAKKYDEWEGEEYEGTSIRGAMKALNKHGICEEKYWPYIPNKKGNPELIHPRHCESRQGRSNPERSILRLLRFVRNDIVCLCESR